MRTIESRIYELVHSKKYQAAFDKLKKQILQEWEDRVTNDEKLLLKINKNGVPEGFNHFFQPNYFIRLDREASCSNGVMNFVKISFSDFKKILKDKNVNEQAVKIPELYSDFKSCWELEYFLDPRKIVPVWFNPFQPSGVNVIYSGPQEKFDPHIMNFQVDLRHLEGDLIKVIKEEIKRYKALFRLKAERFEKYTDDEIYEVKKMVEQGMKPDAITRKLYGKVDPDKDYDLWASNLLLVKRLMTRAKSRKK